MNLVMRGILPGNIVTRNADTLEDDWPYFDDQDPVNSYNPLYLDTVVSNPPYSQTWEPQHKEADPRYARFGLAPKSKADYAFLLHDLYHLKPGGIMAIVLPHGVLFRGGEEGVIRKALIENDHLETVIGLPPNIFFGTGIPTVILVLRQKRESSDVQFVDASKGFAKEGKNNKLRACDIKKITDAVIGRTSVPGFSRLVSKTELQSPANAYNLNIPRYVDSSEPAESWDLYASMFGGTPLSELDALSNFWQAFPSLRAALFTEDGTPYAQPKTEDLGQAIRQHPEVTQFSQAVTAAFAGFKPWLQEALIGQMLTLQVLRQEALICGELFARLAQVGTVPLIDKYQAYQVLDDHWQAIAVDLEMLQTEKGIATARGVDPHYVTKKKGGKDVEEQEGWKGHILPFELVQEVHHTKELAALREKEARLADVGATLDELLESFSEEDKGNDTFNDDGDKFVPAAVAREAKRLLAEGKTAGAFDPESYEAKIIRAAEALADEKALKAAIKKDAAALHLKTKATIEGLSDEQVRALLEAKWIAPLVEALHRLPGLVVDGLTAKLEALVEKYRITYADNARNIRQAEHALAGMLEELDGSEFDLKGLAELKTLLGGG
jgi:type I restriction enzyme M protein